MNRTGMETAGKLKNEMRARAEDVVPSSKGNKATFSWICQRAIQEAGSIGSVPLPAGKSRLDRDMLLFLDKLGERLAFERSGTRLWEGFLTKYESLPGEQGRIRLEEIRAIHLEEWEHFLLLKDAAERLGADPTAVTPAANVAGVASMGLGQVMSDPRTDLDQCLQVILVAELSDNDGWDNLILLADALGQHFLEKKFRRALRHEDEHLAKVRGWIANRSLRAVRRSA